MSEVARNNQTDFQGTAGFSSSWHVLLDEIMGVGRAESTAGRLIAQTSAASLQPRPMGWPQRADKILSQLGRLQPGWAGPESVTPSEQVIKDLEAVVGCFPNATRPPDVEVDAGEGHVTLRWLSDDGMDGLSLVFTGNKFVVGLASSLSDEVLTPWKIKVFAEGKLIDALEQPASLRLLTNR